MCNNAEDLADSIAAFFADLGTQASKVTLVTLSEFGRRVARTTATGPTTATATSCSSPAPACAAATTAVAGSGQRYDADLTSPPTTARCSPTSSSRRFNASVAKVFPGLKWQPTAVML